MEQTSFPSKNLGQIQLCGEAVLEKTAPFQELQVVREPAANIFDEIVQAIQRNTDSSINKKELDNISDDLIRGMNHAVKAEIAFPYESEEEKAVQNELADFYMEHGPKIALYPYTKQPAAVDNMLADFDKINWNALPNSNIPRWRDKIYQANENFKKGSIEKSDEVAEMEMQTAATKIAPQLKKDFDNLLDMMFVYAKLNQNQNLVKAYREIVVFLNSFK